MFVKIRTRGEGLKYLADLSVRTLWMATSRVIHSILLLPFSVAYSILIIR